MVAMVHVLCIMHDVKCCLLMWIIYQILATERLLKITV